LKTFKYQTTDKDIVAFRKEVAENCKWIDEGGYSDVYSVAKNRVLKIGEVNADHYIQYLSYVGLRSANTHFPKVFSVKLYDPDPNDPFSVPYYAVEMEELITLNNLLYKLSEDHGMGNHAINAAMENYWKSRGLDEFLESLRPPTIDFTVPTTEDMREVKDTLNALYTAGAGCDIESKNVMWRYDAHSGHFDAVFTDPVV
jgi:hypothetical protein